MLSIQEFWEVVPFAAPCQTILAVVLAAYVFYLIALAIVRFHFSLLSPFPGPKLAAITGWYETYFEVVKKGGGQFTFEIMRLHKIYGPIIRISPSELHIADSEFYDTIYTSSRAFDKSVHVQNRFGAPNAAFSTPDHEIHKRRRAAMNPFFAKRRINDQAPMIQAHINKIIERLSNEYAGTDNVLTFNDLYASFVSDVIMSYAFNRSYRFLDQPDFVSPFVKSIQGLKEFVHIAQQFPAIANLFQSLPDWLVKFLRPSMEAILHFQNEMLDQVKELEDNQRTGDPKEQEATIFYSLIRSGLPPEDITIHRLRDEAISIVGAAIETTKMASVIISFYIISTPHVLSRLRDELDEAILDPVDPPPLAVLERLPYLYACIQEGIRLSYGAMARSQRISKHDVIQYKEFLIPPGVIVSLDTYHMHHDEAVYPDSFIFKPERWLDDARGPDGQKPLSRYMTAFGRGTRMCAGFNLAYAEMTLVVAALFRSFDFELYETDKSDVDCHRDLIGLEVKPNSKGVRVKLQHRRKA